MANVSTTVPNLVQGVSQQAPSLRFNGQCEEQTNAVGSVIKGLIKRPYAELVDAVDKASELGATSISNKDFYYFINRGESIQTSGGSAGQKATERYVAVINGAAAAPKLRIFNLDDGTLATITHLNSEGGTVETATVANLPDYFDSPGLDFVNYLKGATYADTTYLLNTTKTTARKADSTTPIFKKHDAIAFVKIGAQGTTYRLKFTDDDTGSVDGAVISCTWSLFEFGNWRKRYTAWHVTSVSIIDGGANYTEAPTVTWDQVPYLDAPPVIRLSIHGGSVVSTEILSRGYYHAPDAVPAPTSSAFFTVSGGEGQVSVSTTNGASKSEYATETIASKLVDALENEGEAGSGFTRSEFAGHENYTSISSGNTIFIQRDDASGFTLQASDSHGNTALGAVKGKVQSLSDLPVVAPLGFQVRVEGAKHIEEDDYYLTFHTDSNEAFGHGRWVESAGYAIDDQLDEETMPYSLVNTGTNAFTLRPTAWARREVGDNASNPFPSFEDKKISDLFFFKNRLGFLSEDRIVFSEDSNPTNLFRTTVRTLLDTAPIDVTAATNMVQNLHSAVPFQDNMILFSERGQFIIDGREALTPSTIAVNAVTNYNTDTSSRPEAIGPFIYFPSQRGGFHSINEFALQDAADIYESTDITAQVPSYIPRNSYFKMTGSTTENMLAVTTGDCTTSPATQKYFLYKFVFQERQKVISAWAELTFPFNVYAMEFINSELFILGMDPGNEKMLICKLDMREEVVDGDTTGDLIVHMDARKKHGTFNGSTASFDALVREGTFHQGSGTSSLSFYDTLGRSVAMQAQPGSGTTRSFMATGAYVSGTISPLFDAFIVSIGTVDGNTAYDTGASSYPRTTLTITATNTATLKYMPDSTGNDDSIWTSTTPGSGVGEATDPKTYTSWSATSNATGTPEITAKFKGDLLAGFPYEMSYKFSEPVFKQGNPPVQYGSTRYILRHLTLFFTDAHNFKVKVTPFRRAEKTFTYDADSADTTTSDSGKFRASVLTSAEDTVIELVNDSVFGGNFNSAEFEANVHTRYSRL